MPIERRRPLPVGRYWIDVFESSRTMWETWLRVAGGANVRVEHTEDFPANDGGPARQFVIFATTAETMWPDAEMGFAPNVAGPEVQSSSDTVQRPDPPKPIDYSLPTLSNVSSGMTTALTFVGVSILAVGSLVALLSFSKTLAPRGGARR